MGDPTEHSKSNDANHPDQGSDVEPQDDGDVENEAEVIEPGINSYSQVRQQHYQHEVRRHANGRSSMQPAVSDTVASILSSVSGDNLAVVIPLDQDNEEGLDPERMEKFYSGALKAITKVSFY